MANLWVGVTAVGYGIIMLGAVAGVVLSWRSAWERRDPAVLSLYGIALAGGFLVPMMFFGDPRFKVGTTPLFAVFAGLAFAALWRRVAPSSREFGGRSHHRVMRGHRRCRGPAERPVGDASGPDVDAANEAIDGRWPLDRMDIAALSIVTFVLVLPLWGLMFYQGPPMEEGFMLVFPEQILEGAVPHRDFLHLYGPGSIYMLAAVYKLFGTSIYTERLVGFLQLSTVAYATWFLLRPFGRRIATSGAVLGSVILLMPLGYAAMAWNGALALGLASLAVAATAGRRPPGRGQRNLLLAAGALSGMALLFRPDMILAVGLGLGAWWFQMP
ncbi:MAG: hypothetical protein M5U19_11160 [Microthrixaceae bacterium]|nr:hypothetical protein [Microthrixaceae bacterium]